MISNQITEKASCALCSSTEQEKVFNNFPPPYTVVRCRVCGFYYLSPRLTEHEILKVYGDNSYFEGENEGYQSYMEQEKSLHATFRHFMKTLKKHNLHGGDMLEVGCGYGYLLDEAKGYFSTRTGIEFSHQACNISMKKADRIFEGGIEQIPPADQFDSIIAVNVIEHVYEPKQFLQKLCTHLKSRGKMIIATPDMGSLWRHLMGHRWPSFKIPEHILYFDKNSLHSIMLQAGLKNIRTIPFPHAFPLSLIAQKLNFNLPAGLGKLNLWLPQVMIAMYGVNNK